MNMPTPNPADLAWLTGDDFPHWTTGFCVTLLPNKSPDWVEDILRTFLGAVPALDTTQPYIAHIHAAGSGSIMFENGGFGGMMLEVIRRLSQDTKAVVVLRDFLGNAAFAYVMDGEIITAFDIYFPGDRRGRSPDALNDQLSAVGLLPAYEYVFDEDVEEEDEPERDLKAEVIRALAVATAVTGVRFDKSHLNAAPHAVSLAHLYESDIARRFA